MTPTRAVARGEDWCVLETKWLFPLFRAGDCQVRNRTLEVYGGVEVLPGAKVLRQVRNFFEICADQFSGSVRDPAAQTRVAICEARSGDGREKGPQFALAAQLMTKFVSQSAATPVSKFSLFPLQGRKSQSRLFLNWDKFHRKCLCYLLYS